jgi:5'-deoxy-5'-methylthioadenosine phosphorylase
VARNKYVADLAIIGGSGLYELPEVANTAPLVVDTDYGEVELVTGELEQSQIVFLNRHGRGHNLPPHKINYRANIAALSKLGITRVIATNAVGGIAENMAPQQLALPDQIIDYTWGREHTFYDEFSGDLSYIDFAHPFDEELRSKLLLASRALSIPIVTTGVYGCTQGPRLETAAEIQRLKRDGCTMVGMTMIPEAALAKEANISYASVCFSVNWAAGVQSSIPLEEIMKHADQCVQNIRLLLRTTVLGS